MPRDTRPRTKWVIIEYLNTVRFTVHGSLPLVYMIMITVTQRDRPGLVNRTGIVGERMT
jgi:hypothetical protein